MDKNFNNYIPPYMDYNMMPPNIFDTNEPFLNPIMQYEQGYSYYRYLCMQLEYKMKCKEYEKMCKASSSTTTDQRK